MEYQQGEDREQLTLYSTCLDDMVPADNSVRFIDQFVEQLDLQELGFNSLANLKDVRPTIQAIYSSFIFMAI